MRKRIEKILDSNKGKVLTFPLSLLCLFLLSFAFLLADPDASISMSRDAFTDEGLNTSQIRNWVLSGELNTSECDNFIKTPLFQTYMGLGFSVFGISLLKARIWAMLGCFLFMGLAYYRSPIFKPIFLLAILLSTLNYIGFQYLHFSMAESMASAAILWAVAEFFRSSLQPKQHFRKWILPAVAIWIVIALKNQFMYLAALYIGWLFILFLRERKLNSTFKIYQAILPFIGITLLYIAAIYFPMKDSYDAIMQHQTSGRWIPADNMWNEFKDNFRFALLKPGLKFLVFVSLIGSIITFILNPKNLKNPSFYLFLLLFSWMILEAHKLGIRFTPTRYLVSTVWSMGAVVSVLTYWLYVNLTRENVAIVLVVLALYSFTVPYWNLMENRTFAIQEANQLLAKLALKENPEYIIGPWAPALSWNTKTKSVPVWKNFLNGTDFDLKYPNSILITEADEEDNEQAFSSKNIQVPSPQADSVFIRNKWLYIQKLTTSSLEQ